MATIAENLQTIIDIKADIKTSIENKGVTVGDASFGSYAEKINEISGDFDFVKIGYTQNNANIMYENLMYSKTLYDAWDPSSTSAESLYSSNRQLVYAPAIDTSNVTDMRFMFYHCDALTFIPLYNTSNVTNMAGTLTGCSITSIPQFDTSKVTVMSYCIQSLNKLITIPLLDFGNVSNEVLSIGTNCPELVNIGGFTNLGKGFTDSVTSSSGILTFTDSNKLSRQSCLNIFNSIYDMNLNTFYTQTSRITLHNDVYNLLSADDIAIATNKGWAVQSA